MSIKTKLSFSISLIVAIILILNISIYYVSSKEKLAENYIQQVNVIAKQISVTIEISENAKRFIEDTLGEKLRMAAIFAQNELDPDINNVTNEQLIALTKKLGIEHITLWQREGTDDIVARRSSDKGELGTNSKTWDYWHLAFKQLFENLNASVLEGQKLEHFWSGPINFSTTDPNIINKWGNYYDGTTNYMINPYINAEAFIEFDHNIGTNAVVESIIRDMPDVLEITGIDPMFYGKNPILKLKKGRPVYNLDVRAIPFGQYTYKDTENDSAHIQQALSTMEIVSTHTVLNNQKVVKSFIPIVADKTYVIGITFDQNAIQGPLNRQLFVQSIISLGLVLVTMIASYFIAGFMIRSLKQIIYKVNAIASGNFGVTIAISSNDEFGLLASHVDKMGNNLHNYTTQLKEAAEELRSTKQYLESFVNHTSDAIHVADLHGRIIQVNKAFETMYGWSEAEILGQVLYNVPEEFRHIHLELEATVLGGGSVTDHETVRITKDKKLIDLSITISSIRDEQGIIIAIASISRNITSRKQTEEMIRRADKLAVVGQIAAGVAHEVRNPLTTLRGFVQLQKKSGTISPMHLDIMLTELDQINMIVSEFLVFAKPQVNRYQPVDVQDIVCDIMRLLDSEAKMNNIQLSLNHYPDLPKVIGEANQLKQVFVNILRNGMESMPHGGALTVEPAIGSNDHIILRFIDQGCGIAEEDLLRLGEPFFTKKATGNGLGLMVSQQIITGHSGTLLFKSELGKGTCVEITLPMSTED